MRKFLIFTTTALMLSAGTAFASGDKAPHWDYSTGHGGPENWGKLSAEFATCSTGQAQSPIDITKASGERSGIETLYQPTVVDVVNNGHTIQLNYAPGSKLQSAGQDYQLLQLHFHSSSEHTVQGKSYPLEMHLVHKAADGTLAVVGVMFEPGAANGELAKIWNHMPVKAGEVVILTDMVDAGKLLPENRDFVGYDGSLTTPPCSEGVKWHVLTTPLSLSPEQIAQFRAVIQDNNRPIQPLNGRKLSQHK